MPRRGSRSSIPGVVQASLQREAAPYGLRFGPDPSTHTRCTIGGMIGNNACGPRALGFGKTADNVIALEVVTGSGERLTLDRRTPVDVDSSASLHALQSVVSAHLGTIRTEFGTFGRQVSGYSLEHLLPERKFDVTRFLAGTEGTLAVITKATVRLVADAPYKIMIALGYASMPEAADATPVLLGFGPTAIEGLDRRIVEVVRRTRGEGAVPPLPRGDGWVFVELVGEEPGELAARAAALLAASGCLDGEVVDDPAQALALWKIREDGAGLAGVSLADPAYPGGRTRPSRRRSSGLPARLRRAAGQLRAARAAVRALRRRLRARPDRLPADLRRWGRTLPRPSSRTPPGWWPATAGRCRVSTVTVGPGRRCCRPCTPPPPSRCSAR